MSMLYQKVITKTNKYITKINLRNYFKCGQNFYTRIKSNKNILRVATLPGNMEKP